MMSSMTLGIIVYFVLMFTWMVYIVQELFITGSSALNIIVSKDEGERKQIQVATGIHWDGIEVWLITAIALTFAAFPTAFAMTFEFLYVPMFLLLYAIIARGLSIEVIYKLDNEKWVKIMKYAWAISSILIIFILGIYLTNMFYGYPLDGGEMTKSFVSLFNVTSISGGLLFVVLSFIAGAGWISFTTKGDLGSRAIKFVKTTGIIYMVPVFLLLAFMGMNNQQDTAIFIGEVYSKSIWMFVLPIFTVVAAIVGLVAGWLQKVRSMFIHALVTVALFLATGFVGMYPNLVLSSVSVADGLTISEVMAARGSLVVILIAIVIFYPIVMFYQGWKYKTFTKKINYNDELEG